MKSTKLQLWGLIAGLCALMASDLSAAVHYVSPASTNAVAPYASWDTAATGIQDAVDAATDGDQILVTNGVYQTGGRVVYGALTNRVVIDKAVTVQSVNGPTVTVIQGNPVLDDTAVRCVYLTNNTALIGFTLTQGGTRNTQGDSITEWTGGGAWCESTNAMISNCVFTANVAANGGGGVNNGTLTACVLSNNASVVNYLDGGGGGGAQSSVLNYCQVLNNSTASSGGGADFCTLNFCVISGNTGGGAASSTLNNCVVTNNNSGSGIDSSTANNCTIVGNTANYGGGASSSTLNNCIVYYNQATANDTTSNSFNCSFNACCTAPNVGGNNFTNAPNFVNFAAGDLHLQTPSVCINSGDNTTVATSVDWDGNPRIVGTYVDVGAYEFQSAAPEPLVVASLQSQYSSFATGFAVNVSGSIAGHPTVSVLDFGDGTNLTNQLSATHGWSNAGDYTVTLTAYNADNPGGVSASIIVHVVSNPIYYVALSNATPVSPYNSWAAAATNIQDAVNVAVPGGMVLVSNGIYNVGVTNIQSPDRVAVTRPIKVQSANGPGVTIIQGSPGATNGANSVRCVYLASGSMLAGFTLTNGASPASGGGGVYCSGSAVVSNCVLVGNSTKFNSGGGGFGGKYFNCVIRGNSAAGGGGVASGQLLCCLVISNTSILDGGGIYNSSATNCTLYGNFAAGDGGGAHSVTALNCILNGNTIGGSGSGSNLSFNSAAYCSSTPLPPGPGNTTNLPAFVDPAHGNFHLQVGSHCIDAGNNAYILAATDLDGNPRIVHGTVDIGAYENQNSTPVHYVNTLNGSPVAPYTNWATAARNIQDAVGVAASNETVVVESGTYNQGGAVVFGSETNRVALTNPTTLLSLNGPNVTRIVGGSGMRGVYVGTNAIISGFTITNGQTRLTGDSIREQSGGGIWCEPSGLVMNCLVTSNFAGTLNSIATNRQGGGIYGGVISNCILSANVGGAGGGAAWAQLLNCTLSNNVANQGAGAYGSLVYNGLISSNTAIYNGNAGWGGGLYLCIASNCLVTNNQASGFAGGSGYGTNFNSLFVSNSGVQGGGGCYLNTNYNCVMRNNSSSGGGGGGTLDARSFNCTIAGNSAFQGGGDYQGTLFNCIVYYNTSPNGSNYLGSQFNYSCTAPFPIFTGSIGNFTNAPQFVNLAGGDLHVLTNSPTINAGTNVYVATATDVDGNPRIVGDTVDMGAYEYQGANLGLQIPIPWLLQYGLPPTGAANNGDADGDGLSNRQEWLAGTDPRNASSALRLTTAVSGGSGITVTWSSVTNRTYFVQRNDNIQTSSGFQTVGTNVVGQAGTTSFLDSSATGAGPYFYRVGVQ